MPITTRSQADRQSPRRVTPGPTEPIIHKTQVDPIEFLDHLVKQYGDVVRYQTRYGACFFLRHPEHVKVVLHSENYRRANLVKSLLGNGLLASEGPFWKSQRRLMQPEFISSQVASYLQAITGQCSRTARAWRDAALRGEPVDVTLSMTWVTLRVIIQTMFSDDLSDRRTKEVAQAVAVAVLYQGNISGAVFGNQVQLAPDRFTAFRTAKETIDSMCHEMIARRRAMPRDARPRDLLTLLIEAEETSANPDDIHIRDEIATMLIGGHETTAIALAWAWKALSENPAIEAKMHSEVDAVLTDRQLTFDDLSRLPYTQAVLRESLRLYPPVWNMVRSAVEDDVIDGHPIPRDAAVIISPWFTHRHEEFWPDPQAFDPSRFLDPASKQRHRYAYLPFGGARHQCMGIHFAMMEGIVLLAMLSRQFRIHPQNSRDVLPFPGVTLRQSTGMMARLEPRTPGTCDNPSGREAV